MNDGRTDKSTLKKIKGRPKSTKLMVTISKIINRSNRFMKFYLLNLRITRRSSLEVLDTKFSYKLRMWYMRYLAEYLTCGILHSIWDEEGQ